MNDDRSNDVMSQTEQPSGQQPYICISRQTAIRSVVAVFLAMFLAFWAVTAVVNKASDRTPNVTVSITAAPSSIQPLPQPFDPQPLFIGDGMYRCYDPSVPNNVRYAQAQFVHWLYDTTGTNLVDSVYIMPDTDAMLFYFSSTCEFHVNVDGKVFVKDMFGHLIPDAQEAGGYKTVAMPNDQVLIPALAADQAYVSSHNDKMVICVTHTPFVITNGAYGHQEVRANCEDVF